MRSGMTRISRRMSGIVGSNRLSMGSSRGRRIGRGVRCTAMRLGGTAGFTPPFEAPSGDGGGEARQPLAIRIHASTFP